MQEAYPAVSALRIAEVCQLAANHGNLPIEEGAAALGQALSHHEYALYAVDTGSDNSVFLLVEAAGMQPADTLDDVLYAGPHEPAGSAIRTTARLMRQPAKAWGDKAKQPRQAKLNFRLPDSALTLWNIGPGTDFVWLDDRLGWLSRAGGAGETTAEVQERSHLVDVTRWHDQSDGIAHMLTASCPDPCATAVSCLDGGAPAAAVLREGRAVVWLLKTPRRDTEVALPLPEAFPPAMPLWGALPQHAGDFLIARPVATDYWVNQVLRFGDGCVWLDCVVRLSVPALLKCNLAPGSARALSEKLARSASVLLCYRVNGELAGWQIDAMEPSQWGRHRVWASAIDNADGASGVAYLVKDVVDDADGQIEYAAFSKVSGLEAAGALQFQSMASSNYVLNGAACAVPLAPGLPQSSRGYLLCGGRSTRNARVGDAFALIAVNLEDGRVWERSLEGMQPKLGSCHYEQGIVPRPWPDDWLLLDIAGDNFALQDCAWAWHLPTDRYFAIPLAPTTPDRENASLHYHPGLEVLFAYSTSLDRDDTLEMLLPLRNILEMLQSARGAPRAVLPWAEDVFARSRNALR